jgi:hypothetical protein
VRIKLAPTSREKPAAIEKNAAEEEKSRMMVGGLKAYYSTGRGSQAFTRLARPKEKGAREGALDRSLFQFDKEQWGKQVYMLIR